MTTTTEPTTLSDTDLADLRYLAGQFKDPWAFLGSAFQNSECEFIVIQTLHASILNLREHGKAFSFEGPELRTGRQVDGTDNLKAFTRLVSGGYLLRDTHEGRPTLVFTRKLIDLLKGHLAKP